MADLKRWPMALNQPGYEYPAELFRAEHHDATSGGNGVGAPTALKVTAQAAPDGTVSILTGGATIKSTYAGADGQSYHARNFQPFTLEVPPTGSSSGGRHDLVILRVCDPQYDQHPDHPGGEITAEEAANYDFWWFEIRQGKSATTSFDFPHVKLAHIRRGPNQTIVRAEDIVDLRQLANPQKDFHVEGRNLSESETQSLHTTSSVWPDAATHYAKIPDFATRMKILATVGSARAHDTAGDAGVANGNFFIRFVHPDGSTLSTQQTEWRTSGQQNREQVDIVFSHQLAVPAKWRDQDVRVEFHARKYYGPNVYADGATSFSLQLFFEQEIA